MMEEKNFLVWFLEGEKSNYYISVDVDEGLLGLINMDKENVVKEHLGGKNESSIRK